MKKVILSLAVIATMGCLASCKKDCSCTTYAAVANTVTTISLEELQNTYADITKCSDVNNVVEVAGVKIGMECE